MIRCQVFIQDEYLTTQLRVVEAAINLTSIDDKPLWQ